MKLYHASPSGMLHREGVRCQQKTTCSRFRDGWVFLGSLKYLNEQYFKYCPSGTYYIFEINIDEGKLKEVAGHYKHLGDIDAIHVEPYGVKIVR